VRSEFQAVFIDRDGTIGGTGHFIHPRDFYLYPRAADAIRLLKESGLKVFALTNQHRISRGEATEEEFEQQFKEFGFDQGYICPHGLDRECSCRKPGTGMLLRAAKEHNLDLSKCVVIGDVGDTDMLAAHRVGAMKILVKTGWGEGSITIFRDKWAEIEADYVAEDIYSAVTWLLKEKEEK
jgi:HAD superfamily hydrolase (TIGR01662 family)